MRPFCRIIVNPTRTPPRLASSTRGITRFVHTTSTPRHSPPRHFFLPHQPQSRRISSIIHTQSPTPHHSAFDPLTILIAVSVTAGAGYIANQYLSLSHPHSSLESPPPEQDDEKIETTSTRAYPDMPTTTPPGRPGNLTSEQEQRLKDFWLATLDVFGVETNTADAASTKAPSTTGTATPTTADAPGKPKKRTGLFKSKKDKTEDVAATGDDASNDKHGQTKEFKEALASTSPEQLRQAFWSMVKHDDPDALLLRFLRARKWDVHNALVMLIATMHWRATEMHVDDDIMLRGEEGALKAKDKDSADFLTQLRMGKSVLHGVDKEGRPIVTVRVRLHKGGEQTEKSLERYTVYTIETTRMLLKGAVDTATIVFDMTGFSMANMDYTPVKFMIKCFEANYPESLGAVVVYKAPWIFNQVWRIIKGWLDPVVASKIHFAKTVDELEAYIPRSRILKELDGGENWEYKFTEPQIGENKIMEDTNTKTDIEKQRKDMVLAYERDTVAWASGKGEGQRANIKDQLRENYWRLDPYIRARSHCDREGLLGPGGKLDFYPTSKGKANATSNDDVD